MIKRNGCENVAELIKFDERINMTIFRRIFREIFKKRVFWERDFWERDFER